MLFFEAHAIHNERKSNMTRLSTQILLYVTTLCSGFIIGCSQSHVNAHVEHATKITHVAAKTHHQHCH